MNLLRVIQLYFITHMAVLGKLYHNADNNNNEGSPTHSIIGFGNLFNEKTNP